MITRGFCTFVQHNDQVDYMKQAYALALSTKIHMPSAKFCLITNVKVPSHMLKVFDHVCDIPGSDDAVNDSWKIANRHKIYSVTPYDETIIMDADMLILNDISHWWNFLSNYNLYFVSQVRTYRDAVSDNSFYRRTFVENQLPNLYFGLHYYKKTKENKMFLEMLKTVLLSYQTFYEKFTPKHQQNWRSMDVSGAITSKIMNNVHEITSKNSYVTFTHMKSHNQHWTYPTTHWMEKVNVYFNEDCEIKIDNFLQKGVLHYVESEFLTDMLLQSLEKKYYEHTN